MRSRDATRGIRPLARRGAWMGLALAVAAGGAVAQEKDFSKGFQRFFQLGLPDAAKATYVQLDAYSSHGFDRSYYLHELKLSGNAWMLVENTNGPGRFIVDRCRVAEVYDQDALGKLRKQEQEAKAKAAGKSDRRPSQMFMWDDSDGRIGGKWKKANAEGDLDKMVEYMKKKIEKPEKHDWFFRSGGYSTLFLSAIHFHQMGHTNKANQLVDLLFTHAGDRRKVLMQTLNSMGDAMYDDTYERFSRAGDWAAFSRDLDALLGKFAAGWQMAPAVKKLSGNVKVRVAQTNAPPLTEEGLTDEDRALAADLAAAGDCRSSTFSRPGGLWVLPGKSRAPISGEPEHAITRIQRRGMKSVPLLLAMLKDEFLTRVDLERLTGQSYSYSDSSSDDGVLTEEQIEKAYCSMRRPASCSDVAAYLLLQVIPAGEDGRDLGEVDREALADEGRQWYGQNKDKKPVELARVYLRDGTDQQQSGALQILLKSADEADLKAVEEHLLSSDDLLNDTDQLRQYITARGEKAKTFLDRYEAAMKKQMETGENAQMYKDEGLQKRIQQVLGGLKEIVAARPPGEILDQVVKGEKKWEEVGTALTQRLGREKPEQALALVLDAALKATDSEVTRTLVGFAAQTRYLSRYTQETDEEEDEEGSEEAEPEEPGELDVQLHREAWTKLLADARPTRDPRGGTVGDVAAWTIETVYAEDSGQAAQAAHRYLGRLVIPLLRQRAEARLAGKAEDDLAALPDVDEITPEQGKAVAARILALPDAELAAALDKLSLADRVALGQAADEKEAKLNAKLGPLAHRIQGVTAAGETNALTREAEAVKGGVLNKEAIEKLYGLCERAAKDGRILWCTVVRQPSLAGVEVKVMSLSPQTKDFDEYVRQRSRYGAGDAAVISAYLSSPGLQGSATWPLEAGTKPASAPGAKPRAATAEDDLLADALSEVDQQKESAATVARQEFWDKIAQFCAATNLVCRSASIQLTGMPAAKKTERTQP